MTALEVLNTVVYYSIAMLMIGIALIRWQKRPRPAETVTPELLAMLIFVGSMGAAGAVLAIPSRTALDALYPNVAQLAGNLLVITAGAGLVATVTFSQMEGGPALRRIRRRIPFFVAVAVAMTVCFVSTHVGGGTLFVEDTDRSVIVYYGLYSLAFGWTALDLAVLLSRQLRTETVRWRRLGVMLNLAATVTILVYLVGRMWSIAGGRLGLIPSGRSFNAALLETVIGTILPFVGVLLGAAGLMSQFWARRVVAWFTASSTDRRRRRLYRSLAPLWALIGHGTLAAVHLPERHQLSSPTMKLCGRVFELCDIELRAARHLPAADREGAVRARVEAGQLVDAAEAYGDALALAVGVPIEQEQNPPQHTGDDLISFSQVDDVAMVDIETQARRLLRAYHALHTYPELYELLTRAHSAGSGGAGVEASR